eukprot:gene11458-9952_t
MRGPGSALLLPWIAGAAGASCDIDRNVDYAGNDITYKTGVRTFAACCELCSATAGCSALTWHNYTDRRCYLKTSSAGRTPVPGCFSSSVRAAAEPGATFG